MAQSLILTDKFGTTLDLSQYCRVQDDAGLDPYPSFEEPAFIDSPLGEGQPIGSVDVKNRELVYPMWVSAASKDTMQALVSQIDGFCTRLRSVQWTDDGATRSSYLDPTYARVDASYRFNPARKAYLACVLRVFCAPPYAHTGTERIISTVMASSAVGLGIGVATLPSGSMVGDARAMMKMGVTMSGQVPGPLGRIIGFGAVPTGYRSFIAAASLINLHAQATLQGASGAPGSQVVMPATTQLATTAQLARFALSASPHAGANRVFGVMRAGRMPGMAMFITDSHGRGIGPTGMADGMGGMQIVDLGIARVGSHQATQLFSIGGGAVNQLPDDAPMNLSVGADRAFGQLAGLFVLPENGVNVLSDHGYRVAGRWFAGSGVASTAIDPSIDDYGNSYSTFTGSGYLSPSGLISMITTLSGALAMPFSLSDFRHRSIYRMVGIDSGGPERGIQTALSDESNGGLITAQFYKNSTGSQILSVGYGFASAIGSVAIPSHADLFNDHALVLDVVRQGEAVYANLRPLNATGINIIGGVGSVSVPIACVGLATSANLRARTNRAYVAFLTASAALLGHWMDALSGAPGASDIYTMDGAQGISYRSPVNAGSAVQLITDRLRGAPLRLDARDAGVTVFTGQRDGGPINDPFSVEIRVRERFRHMVQ